MSERTLKRLGNKFSNKIIKIVSDKANDAYIHYHEIVLNKRLLFVSISISITIWVFDILFGSPFDIAITIAILDHAIKNIFTLVFGIPATTSIGLNFSDIKRLKNELD